MAEGFEGCHVPQQSRRDKLRVVTGQNHPSCLEPTINLHRFAGLLPMYDPSSFISSDLLTCASATGQGFHNHNHNHHHHHHHHHHQTSLLPGLSEGCKENAGCSIKEEGVNLMGFAGNLMNTPPPTSNSRLHQTLHPYFDLQSSLPMNPSPIQDINSNPLFYSSHTLQNRRDFDHAYSSGGEVVVFKPEPLSLSLSSHPTYQNSHQLELNLQRYGSGLYPSPIVGSMSNNISKSSVPLGPFTGYASILKGSRFLKPAQQLLEEFCEIWCPGNYSEKFEADSGLMDSPSETLGGIVDDSFSSGGDGGESRRKKSRLISMLDEVYRRYKQYYQQMQEVVASFQCVSGLGNAAPYANLAIISMSKHFRCLKNAISDQLRITNKAPINYCQKYGPNSGFLDQQPVWRPQRGLPERAVTVLRAWLFEHFLHPYPTDTDKVMLAKQTGLSRSQVSNWFINARVRLWKPMVEEIHMLETRQGQKHPQDRALNRSTDHLPSANSLVSDNASKSTQLVQDIPSKRTRNELQNLGMANEGQLNLSYNNLSSQDPQMDGNVSIAGGNGGVSLTLGLHQNVIDLSEPFAMNAVQRYGLGIEDNINGDGYVMSGFEAQSRHFARDVIGGQLLHDFVG